MVEVHGPYSFNIPGASSTSAWIFPSIPSSTSVVSSMKWPRWLQHYLPDGPIGGVVFLMDFKSWTTISKPLLASWVSSAACFMISKGPPILHFTSKVPAECHVQIAQVNHDLLQDHCLIPFHGAPKYMVWTWKSRQELKSDNLILVKLLEKSQLAFLLLRFFLFLLSFQVSNQRAQHVSTRDHRWSVFVSAWLVTPTIWQILITDQIEPSRFWLHLINCAPLEGRHVDPSIGFKLVGLAKINDPNFPDIEALLCISWFMF